MYHTPNMQSLPYLWPTAHCSPEAIASARPVISIDPENRFKLDLAFLLQFAGKQPKWGPVGYITYKRTYARPKYKSQKEFYDAPPSKESGEQPSGSEEFWETLQRVTEGTFTMLKHLIRSSHRNWDEPEAQRKAQEFYMRMWQFKWLPPGRGLWAMGTWYVERYGGGALNNCGFKSTKFLTIDVSQGEDFAEPFCALMDWSMLGVGMGFDVRGAGHYVIQKPEIAEDDHLVHDTRQAWVDLIRRVLLAYVGKAKLPRRVDYTLVRKEGEQIRGFGGTASGPGPLAELYSMICDTLDKEVGKNITTSAIVDIMNLIGKCVVAGNVRRSSEIAIGHWQDAEFTALKDNKESNDLYGQMQAQAQSIEDWARCERRIARYRDQQKIYSVIDPEYASIQDNIDSMEKEQRQILDTDPVWKELDKAHRRLPLNHHRWASNNAVLCDMQTDYTKPGKQAAQNGEPGIGWLDNIRKYGRMIDPINWLDEHAEGFNPCAEQSLWDDELCCLVETFPTLHESLEDYLRTLKFAYLYAKCITGIPTHRPRTNAVMAANRRIGTSMAGIAEMYDTLGIRECRRWWDTSYKYLKELDKEYSRWMAVPTSIKITSVKPGGTIPLLVGKEGGMKQTSSEWFFRTIRIDHSSPMVAKLAALGYRVEQDRYTPRSMVVYVPVHSPGKRYAKDWSIWEQVMLCSELQRWWSDNMVSVTITFNQAEGKEIPRILEMFEDRLKTISFLPVSDHGYLQAPYIPITREQFESATAKIKGDLFAELESLDVHETKAEDRFCSTDKCEILPS